MHGGPGESVSENGNANYNRGNIQCQQINAKLDNEAQWKCFEFEAKHYCMPCVLLL